MSGSKDLLSLLCDVREGVSEEPCTLVLRMKRNPLSR